MNEIPVVRVGIMSTREATRVTLRGIYSSASEAVVTGELILSLSDGGLRVRMNGCDYDSLTLVPTSLEGDTFEIEGVTIGKEFHWERRECQRFRGALKAIASGGELLLINEVDVETYLKSVISSEMAATASINLLRAHAVISRSWLMNILRSRGKRMLRRPAGSAADKAGEICRWWNRDDHSDFDVCADDHCQRYQGVTRIVAERAFSAVEDTRGEVLTYDGQICDTRFSKCCGGVFERFESCWEDEPKAYLKPLRDSLEEIPFPDLTDEEEATRWIESVPDAFCNTRDKRILSQVLNGYDRETADFFRWTVTYTRRQLGEIIADRLGENLGDVVELRPLQRGTSGRIIRLEIVGTSGRKVIGKELMIRRTLSTSHLLSSAFTVETDGELIRLRGAGWGHGVGLCQIGAAVMGERGFAYDVILKHYYPGGNIERIY